MVTVSGYRLSMSIEDTVQSLGEAGVLARILPLMPTSAQAVLGPGDDAAILRLGPDTVLTTDTMFDGPDFRMGWSLPEELGVKAVGSNLTDVAAMGARPVALLIALGVPADTPVAFLERLARGIADACAVVPGLGVVGGDLSVTDRVTIAVTALGSLDGAPAVLRSGARPGDRLAVSGVLGWAAGGLALLFNRAMSLDAADEPHPDPALAARLREKFPELLQAQLAPRPPVHEGVLAARSGATAMLDVSDGLSRDLHRICRGSGVSAVLDAEVLQPEFDQLAGMGGFTDEQARRLLLGGGEDHALLACFPAEAPLPAGFRQIGRVQALPEGVDAAADAALVLLGDEPVPDAGWDPFTDWDGRHG